jgi:hypothetical protein
MMVNIVTLSVVSLAPLLMWSAVSAACAVLVLLECMVLSVAVRRDPGNRKIVRPLSRARELAVLTGSLTIIFIVAHWRLELDTDPARYVDVQTFVVGACTVCGWLATIITAATLFGGMFALITPATQISSAEATMTQRTDEPEAGASAEPHHPVPEVFPDVSATQPSSSSWMEFFLVLSIVNLVVLVVTLLLRRPQALPDMVTGDPNLGIAISLGGAVLFPAFIAGFTWIIYKSAPRTALVGLALCSVLTGVGILYNGLHLLLG